MSEVQRIERQQLDVEGHESIFNREHIETPPEYVSVYHETRNGALNDINSYGLQYDVESSNFGDSGKINRLNTLLREVRPSWAQDAGLDRQNVIFAYPDLIEGHGMPGYAEERFNDRKHQDMFETLKTYSPKFLADHSIHTWEDLKVFNINRFQSDKKTAGAILEMKVDPATCYVGDLSIIEEQRYPGMDEEMIRRGLTRYWENILKLQDLLQWYKKPEEDETGMDHTLEDPNAFGQLAKKKGAPTSLPSAIRNPEILIPYDIPQKLIRVIAS